MPNIITIFGSSRPSEEDPEYKIAYDVGRHLALAGYTVCNGGYGGSMTASARGAKEAGGSTVGVTSEYIQRSPNRWIDKEVRVPTMVDRLLRLVELGEAYVILKGGTGTLLELACVWEFINKGVIREKPIVVVGPFWKDVISTLRDELLWEGVGDCTRFIQQVETAEECAKALKVRFGSGGK